jgi:AraC-like DNA-binding protein
MERASFRPLICQRSGIEAVEADTTFAFGRHTHEQFGVGLIERGAQKSASGRGLVEASAGDVITVNPGEVHDGAPIGDGGRSWRMLYLDPAIVAELALDITEGRKGAACEFSQPKVRDSRIAAQFAQLFRAVTGNVADLHGVKADETLLLVLAALLEPASATQRSIPARIASARALIDDDPMGMVTLSALADEAGLSRYQFLRAFAKATGLTPHAYILQRRIHYARQLIRHGARLAEAAAQSGFADQSHMQRLFVRSFGMTPGAYAAGVG